MLTFITDVGVLVLVPVWWPALPTPALTTATAARHRTTAALVMSLVGQSPGGRPQHDGQHRGQWRLIHTRHPRHPPPQHHDWPGHLLPRCRQRPSHFQPTICNPSSFHVR